MMTQRNSFDEMMNYNLEKVYHTIVNRHPVSRIEIANQTGLHKMTVTNCVKKLLEAGLVCEVRQGEAAVGRPPILLELSERAGVFIGIEINIISCKLLVADMQGRILEKKISGSMIRTPELFVQKTAIFYHACLKKYGDKKYGVVGIGIALPGNYDDRGGTVEYISNMQNWNGFPLQAAFAAKLPGVPVMIQNAGRAGAKGEIAYGRSDPDEQLAYIHGARGLALSLYSHDGVHVGERGFQARFGHMIIDVDGRQCVCGNRGCLEMYASVGAIGRALYPDREMNQACLKDIFRRAEQPDEQYRQVLQDTIHYLAIGIANIINCFNPKRICIGGYLGMLLEEDTAELNAAVNQLLLPCFRDDHKIFISSQGEWGAALGCTATVRESLIKTVEKSGRE